MAQWQEEVGVEVVEPAATGRCSTQTGASDFFPTTDKFRHVGFRVEGAFNGLRSVR